MMLHKIFKGLAPVAAVAMAVGLSGCDGMNVKINDVEGVPLAELDQSGDPPTEVVLAGPDTAIITDGDTLEISVEGEEDAVSALRFSLEDGTLGIAREKDSWKDGGAATVRITMPSPSALVIAGSGTIEAQSLAKDADITIGGSGTVSIASIDSDSLDVTVGGNGDLRGSGRIGEFDLTIGGSGDVEFADVQIDDAEINIGGSGSAVFASDGTVEANIAGSGDITVNGSAKCTLSSFGSGTLNCQPGGNSAEPAEDADAIEGGDEAVGDTAAE